MEKIENRKLSFKTVLALLVCAIVFTSTFSYIVFSNSSLSFTTVVEEGSMITEASYIIFVDGSTYYARNGETGEIEYSGTNATAVIENTIATGNHIHIQKGTYPDIRLKIEVSNVRITGVGKGTLLTTTLNQRVIWAAGTAGTHLASIVIEDLYINGSGTGSNQRGVELLYSDFCIVQNVYIENCGYDNFLIIGDSGSPSYGNRIVNCWSKNAGDDNFNINKAHRNTISNCYSVDATNDNYHISQGSYRNIIDSCVSVSAGAYGVNLYPDPSCKFNTISNNLIQDSGSDGIFVNQGERNTVVGNTLESNTGIGIKLYNTSYYNVVSANNIYGSTRGIWLDTNCHFNIINDNFVDYSTNYGIAITDSWKNAVDGNEVKNIVNYDGILVADDADKNAITDNVCVNNGRYGIYINHTTSAYNLVVGNLCMDNTTDDIIDSATSTEIHSCWNGTSWIT